MNQRSETNLSKHVVAGIRRMNGYVLNVHGHAMQAPGWPDLFVAHRLLPGGAWVELKVGGNGLSPAQRRVGRELAYRGVQVVTGREVSGCLTFTSQGQDSASRVVWDVPTRDVREAGGWIVAALCWLRDCRGEK